jgi:Leucine-rich repeat (LRR) protein
VARECDQALQEVHDLPQAMFGLESYMERVETVVTSEQSNADRQYVGVRGMGGVGKTLLLQRVYASEKIHDHFRGAKFIWCPVGQTPDIMALYQTLSAKLGLDLQMNLNLEDYKLKLNTQFKQKRVFLVLDDVWKEESFNSLDVARGKGSVTLLSTRNQDVFDRSPRHITQQNMEPLSKEDSWRLFCAHAFKPPSNVPFELEALALAQRIADECEGLPLALKVVGGAMSGKTNPKYEWDPLLKALRESRMQDETVQKQLYDCLKLGYDLLSEVDCRLKKCFHYFAAFPEDSTIVFEEILFHWTGEGLVPAHDGADPTADAFSLLKKLWERSFIESNGQFDSNICYVLNFKVHDVMRDLAFYLLKNDCGTPHAENLYVYRPDQNLDEVPKECTKILKALRLSLAINKLEKIPESLYAPRLVTLLLGRNPIISLPAKFASNFPNLTVLNLRDVQFRYLPDELGDLKNLTFLDLSNCYNLKILPDTVRKLHKLKFLILDECWSLKYLPSGVNDLTSLQVLHTAHCYSLTWAEHTLSNVARGKFLDHVQPTVEASLVDICGLVHLTELTISADIFAVVKLEKLPHNIFTLTKLKLLQVCLNIRALPAEMVYRCMQLQEFELCSSELKYLPSSFTCCGPFPTLVELKLCCYNLVKFPEVDEGAMSKLRTLDLTGCSSLKTVPLSLERLPSLKSLIVNNMDFLKQSCKINCDKSAIWSMWHIQYYSAAPGVHNSSIYLSGHFMRSKYIFGDRNYKKYYFCEGPEISVDQLRTFLETKYTPKKKPFQAILGSL